MAAAWPRDATEPWAATCVPSMLGMASADVRRGAWCILRCFPHVFVKRVLQCKRLMGNFALK